MKTEKTVFPAWIITIFYPEFWSAFFIHTPAIIYLFFHSIKLKSYFIPTLLNPLLDEPGTLFSKGKSEINRLFPHQYIPKEVIYFPGVHIEDFSLKVNEIIGFPCFAKPDNLFQGIGVSKMQNIESLTLYLKTYNTQILIQQLLPIDNEFAVFIVRIPGEKVKITNLTAKQFLKIKGDGIYSLNHLLKNNLRYKLSKKYIDYALNTELDLILPAGEEMVIQPAGNHIKGTRFFDITNLITPKMELLFDSIVPASGIHYGRFDIKAPSLQSLETGVDLKIIEFNGAIAEPVGYLDSKYNWFQMQKIIFKHSKIQCKIVKILQNQQPLLKTKMNGIEILRYGLKMKNQGRRKFNEYSKHPHQI